jgi:ubiquinone/menaquinone biosynthesis C-methylase UbiE
VNAKTLSEIPKLINKDQGDNMNYKEDIFTDNMEKYSDPEMYDLQYEGYMKDFPLIYEWANKLGGQLIDLACGTGRITIPLAERGFDLIGIDLNKGMIERAKKKSTSKGLNIQWYLQDCTQFELAVNSNFIYMTGNSFQHFLTNESQDQLLQSVYSHLNEQGVFIFGTRFPLLHELGNESVHERFYIDEYNRKVKEVSNEEYDSIKQILKCLSKRTIYLENGDQVLEEDSISLRYVYPQEMDRLLIQNGFDIIEVYGSWGKDSVQGSSTEMIYVCKKR